MTNEGESLLFMVDFDTGTIKVRGTGDTESIELYTGMPMSEFGMKPAFSMSGGGTKIRANLAGPFENSADAENI